MLESEARSKLARAQDAVVHAASATRDKAREAARIVREAEPDTELGHRAQHATQHGLDRAGSAVSGAAPAIGKGAEIAARKVGQALTFVGRPLGSVVGVIAGTVGGWWNKAAESRSDLPPADEQACRAHFATLAIEGMSFDDARSGYAIGYLAGCNPDYGAHSFEHIEPDLRHGFAEDTAEFDALRDFARFGYDRGRLRR